MEDQDILDAMSKAVADFEIHGLAYAKSKAVSWHLQESKSSILAEQCKAHPELPVNQREIIGRASEAYKTHLEGTKKAIHKENKAKVLMEAARMSFEMYRSRFSMEKAKAMIQ